MCYLCGTKSLINNLKLQHNAKENDDDDSLCTGSDGYPCTGGG